ncbi:DUF1772 domain-containing protein [Embleya sp. NBC_00896]|uniref:anthrone oxygenase family protein n=1 Tax=Embleya sp. NBC_00896 TaxID=2975961 RepID=UPI00386B558A|nr:DUF1772 domain-containing protein [Embleya sp. NBC_00896]
MTHPSATPSTTGSSRVPGILLGATLVTTGLVAGVYYCFAVAIMPGLAQVDDRTFVDVLQQVNEKIENPFFFASFFGAPILGAISIHQHRKLGHKDATRWIIAGVALSVLGMLVTIGGNIPLNNKLADAGDPAKIADPAALRESVENTWNAWNITRTLAGTAALAALTRAAILHGRATRNR